MNFLKKLMQQEKQMLSKLSKSPTSLKLVSLLVAVLLFLSLNGQGNLGVGDLFKTEKYISNIPVNVVKDDDKIITGIPDKIGVNIKGSEMDVKNFEKNAQNVTATINITGRKDGNYKISSNEFSFSQTYGVEIIPLVNNYSVTVDTLTEVTMPVEVTYANKQQNDSILLSDYILEEPNVTFDVGQTQKEKIASVRVILDISEIDTSKNKNEYTYNVPLKVYNQDGELMDLPTDLPSVEVVQKYELKTLAKPVSYKIINNNTDKYISYICKDTKERTYDENCQDSVKVYGDEEKIQELDSIVYNVDLKDFDETSKTALATPSLESGVYVENSNGYNVQVGLEKGEKRTFKNVPINVENLDTNLEVANLEDINLNLKVTGATSIIDDLTTNDFEVYVDAADITKANIVTLPVQIHINDFITYELSEQEITIEFKETE